MQCENPVISLGFLLLRFLLFAALPPATYTNQLFQPLFFARFSGSSTFTAA
jgi:hypothetical protein